MFVRIKDWLLYRGATIRELTSKIDLLNARFTDLEKLILAITKKLSNDTQRPD